MKKMFGVISVAATMAMTAGIASAAGWNDTTVKIPFSFIVGNTELPAGEYVVRESPEATNVVALQSVDARNYATTLIVEHESDEQAVQAELSFEKYGDHYFLARVTRDGTDKEVVLTPSLMEHAIAATSMNKLALVGQRVPIN